MNGMRSLVASGEVARQGSLFSGGLRTYGWSGTPDRFGQFHVFGPDDDTVETFGGPGARTKAAELARVLSVAYERGYGKGLSDGRNAE